MYVVTRGRYHDAPNGGASDLMRVFSRSCVLRTWFKDENLQFDDIEELIEEATDDVEGPSNMEALSILHTLLVQKVEAYLEDCDSLVFVPGLGSLATIPFAALYDNKRKEHLIERYNVSVVPSIVTLHRCLNSQKYFKMDLEFLGPSLLQEPSLEPEPSGVSEQSPKFHGKLSSEIAFIAGNPEPMGLRFNELRGAEEEAKKVAALFKVTPYVGKDMTKHAVLNGLSTSKVVLLATHGMVDDDLYPHGCLVLQASPKPIEVASTSMSRLSHEVDMFELRKQEVDVLELRKQVTNSMLTPKVSTKPISSKDLKGKSIAKDQEQNRHQRGPRHWRGFKSIDIGSKQKRAVEAPQVLTAEEIVALEGGVSAGLVVLSACQSGLGKATPREGILGLGRALLQAGAVTIITTLWKVNDKFTCRFVTDLFQELLIAEPRGRSVSECMKKVITDMIREGQPLKHWAAFTIAGSPLLRLFKSDNSWASPGLDKYTHQFLLSGKSCPRSCRVCEKRKTSMQEDLDRVESGNPERLMIEMLQKGARLSKFGESNFWKVTQ